MDINKSSETVSDDIMTIKLSGVNPLFNEDKAVLTSLNSSLRSVNRQFFNPEEPMIYAFTVLEQYNIKIPDCDISGDGTDDLIIAIQSDKDDGKELYFVFSYMEDIDEGMYMCYSKIMTHDELDSYLSGNK